MRNWIREYRKHTYEEKLMIRTPFMIAGSTLLALGKMTIGLFSDYIMCAVGGFGLLLVAAKLQCVFGVRSKRRSFTWRNTVISVCLFTAGLVYMLYMLYELIAKPPAKEYSPVIAVLVAAIAFTEMGFAVYGLVRTKRKGHFYRDVKIISFISAMTAILTAQIALLSTFSENMQHYYNAFTGLAVGGVTVLLSIYVYFAPTLSIIDREHNIFVLIDAEKNRLITMDEQETELVLHESNIYGNYVYRAKIDGKRVDGHIVKGQGFFKDLHLAWKIILLIFSEILIFVWLGGYVVYYCKTANLPDKLKEKMQQNGFEKERELS
ncbi:MAG: hypothetical protein IJX09_00065 [Clostridia bacterium]|nr:hypothetical protein [Clostridia bacterium]